MTSTSLPIARWMIVGTACAAFLVAVAKGTISGSETMMIIGPVFGAFAGAAGQKIADKKLIAKTDGESDD